MTNHFQRGKYRAEEPVIDPSLAAIERAYDVLLALPTRDSARFFKLREHQAAAAGGDLQRAHRLLFLDAYNWLKFY